MVLAMLRECARKPHWENSFTAVNMHPHHRLGKAEWLQKINHDVLAADKFEKEKIDLRKLLPKTWTSLSDEKRQGCLRIVESANGSWGVDLIVSLRSAGMPLSLVIHMYKIVSAEKQIAAQPEADPPEASPTSVRATTKRTRSSTDKKTEAPLPRGTMIFHNPFAKVPDMSKIKRFDHMIMVRNRSLGADKATTISPYLDVEQSKDNERMLKLCPDDLNMNRILQESSCRHGKRRQVASRSNSECTWTCVGFEWISQRPQAVGGDHIKIRIRGINRGGKSC